MMRWPIRTLAFAVMTMTATSLPASAVRQDNRSAVDLQPLRDRGAVSLSGVITEPSVAHGLPPGLL